MIIHIQLPAPDPLKILYEELAEEVKYEEAIKSTSFRAELLRKIIKRIEEIKK